MRRAILDGLGDCLSEKHYVRLHNRVADPVRLAVCAGRNDERVVLDSTQVYLTSHVYQRRRPPLLCRSLTSPSGFVLTLPPCACLTTCSHVGFNLPSNSWKSSRGRICLFLRQCTKARVPCSSRTRWSVSVKSKGDAL